MTSAEIAIAISLGSLIVSISGFAFSIYTSRKSRIIERARIYDSVYHDASELLLYVYKGILDEPFTSDDKDFEQAVNEYGNLHWVEQMYGSNCLYPNDAQTFEEKQAYRLKVEKAYRQHEEERQQRSFLQNMMRRSPVFHLDDESYTARFNDLLDKVTRNLSYFSPAVFDFREKMRLRSADKVRAEYTSLQRVNESSCEPINEHIDDPYLGILLTIRHEYRELNKPFRFDTYNYLYSFKLRMWRLKRFFSRKNEDWD